VVGDGYHERQTILEFAQNVKAPTGIRRREMSSRKVRFDVFKRDGFKCQYCGRTPPAVILELDHIIPKSKGGPESIDNYITACFDCNRGKGKHKLDNIPSGISDNIESIEEKRRQLKAFNRLIEKQEREYENGIRSINKIFSDSFPNKKPNDKFSRTSIKRFLSLLPLLKVEDAMMLACSQKLGDPEKALPYFCGICWNWIKKPETRNW